MATKKKSARKKAKAPPPIRHQVTIAAREGPNFDAPVTGNAKAFQCPSCGKHYQVVSDPPDTPLPAAPQFDFACSNPGCGYEAGMGLG